MAAGYAPVYAERPIDAEEMAPVRAAIDKILTGHAPFPAVVVDHRWDLVSANDAGAGAPHRGRRPRRCSASRSNALRISLHPDGLAPRIANLAEWSSHLLDRLRREAAVSADPALDQLIAELRTYPGVVDGPLPTDGPAPLFVPLQLRAGDVDALVRQHGGHLRHRPRHHRRRAVHRVVLPRRRGHRRVPARAR